MTKEVLKWWLAATIVWAVHLAVVVGIVYTGYYTWPQILKFLEFIGPVVGLGAATLTWFWAMGVYYDD